LIGNPETAAHDPLPVVTSDRLVLRPPTADDVEPLRAILAEPEVSRWWGERDAEWVRSELVECGAGWTITLAGAVAGWIEFDEETEPEYLRVGIDIFLATGHHGCGYGREAVRAAIGHFRARGYHRFTIDPAVENERAIRSYTATGFKPVGVMRSYERRPDGTWRDSLLMDLLVDELPPA
jgi:aminoglycoside 6'-N-acetyltransferase